MKLARIVLPLVGEIFQERYRIVSELGAGGFGSVYKGEQLTTGQQVAIKVVRFIGAHDEASIERSISRLEREMRLCAMLHHPNIVGLIDFGRTEDGCVYLVFEFVPGKNLEQVLAEEGPLDPREARHLMLEVLDALSCAHAQGVIHRDLKPSNIMVISTGARRNALVLDFGIGAVTDSDQSADNARITASNEVLGTIAYAAPEQLRDQLTSPASDLYSWGLVFLECLTARPAVPGGTLIDVLLKQISGLSVEMPPALEAHELGRLLKAVTAKAIEQRPASTVEVMQRLEACRVDTLGRFSPEAGTPATPAYRETLRVEFAPPDTRVPTRSRAPVSVEVKSAPAPPETAPADTNALGERRQVTLVACTFSVVGEGVEPIDVEEMDGLIAHGQDLCARAAVRFRGHVASVLGTQALFRFGFPAAEEDDARRAARAATAMIAEIEQHAAELSVRHRLEVRVGIHTGFVVSWAQGAPSAQRLGAGVGVTGRIAAQVSELAAPGTAVVSGSTQRLLRHHFTFAGAETHDFGWGAGTLSVYRLVGAVSAGESITAPMVDREREMDALIQRFGEAEQGVGQIVLLTGEAGIGKSRLVQELAARLRGKPHHWLECRSEPEDQNSPLRPFISLLERTLELGEQEDAEGKRGKLTAFLESLDFLLPEVMPLFEDLLGIPRNGVRGGALQTRPGMDPRRVKELTLNALLSLIFELSERATAVLTVEDVHWADPTTLELLTKIVQEAPSARLLVVLSARQDFTPPWPSSAMAQIQLGRLGRKHVEALVAQLAGEAPPSSLIDRIAERTDGIPLFVEELTRMVVDSGRFSWPPKDQGLLTVPISLRDLLMARLDRLGSAKGTAQIAAVIGREFTFDLLHAVSPLSPAALRDDLDALVGADLVHRKRRSRAQSYVFKHALIQETAYESMLRRPRRKVHADIARALEERFPDAVVSRLDVLALHLAAAEEKARAIWCILEAATGALQRSALAETVGFAQQALGWLEAIEPGPERTELELNILGVQIPAIAAMKGPGAPEVEAGNARAQALLDDTDDNHFTLPTLARLTLFYQMRARFPEAIATGRRCLALAERAADTPAQIVALSYLAQNLMFTAVLHESREAAERALSLYDPEEHQDYCLGVIGMDLRVVCQGTLGLVLWFLGYPEQALTHATAALSWAEELDHANSIAWALLYLVSIHYYHRDHDKVEATSARLREVSERHGLYMSMFAAVWHGWLTRDVEVPEQILAGFRAYGQLFSLPYWSSTVAESEAARGRLDAAIERLDACIAESEATGEIFYVPELFHLKGRFVLQRDGGATLLAEACLRRAIALARAHGSRMCELRAAVTLGGILRSVGRPGEARDLLEPSYSGFTEGHDRPDLVEARALLDALASKK